MSKDRLTQDILDDYLLDAFTELRPHVELHHPECSKEMEQAYTQLKEIVEEWGIQKKQLAVLQALFQELKQQKPTVNIKESLREIECSDCGRLEYKRIVCGYCDKQLGVEVVE